MSPRWRKVRGDFRQHRLQVLLVACGLLLGTAVVVAAWNAYVVLQREIGRSYARSNSPDLVLWFDPLPAGVVDAIRAQPGVVEAEPRRIIATKAAGRNPGEWLPMRIVIVRDFADQRVGIVHHHGGDWPAPDAGVLIEQSSLPLLAGGVGSPLRVRAPGGEEVALPIAGSVHDPAVAPGTMELFVYAYASPAIAARLGQSTTFDQVAVLMEDRNAGPARLAETLNATLAARGTPSLRTEVLANVHPHAGLMAALLQVLRGLAGLAFVCSTALAAFAVSLWMKRETRQVGIMKTIGARTPQLAAQYLALVGPVVVLAAGLGLLGGAALGRALIAYCAAEQNLDISSPRIPSGLAWMEVLGAIGLPLLAVAVPIVRAAGLSAREAIHDAGIGAPQAPGWSARWVAFPSRAWTFALRNSFRRRGRLAVTLLGLGAGGAVFLTANNLYRSLMHVIDTAIEERGHDLQVQFPRPLPIAELEALGRGVPGVDVAEAWQRATVDVFAATAADASPDTRTLLAAYPVASRLAKAPPRLGRWPEAKETNAIVVTRPLQARVPALRLGAEVTLGYHEGRTLVRIVGVVDELAVGAIYADANVFAAVTGVADRASELRLRAVDRRNLAPVVAALDRAILDARVPSSTILTRWDVRRSYDEHFANFVTVCNLVALSAAAIGALCLVAFACLNVIERAREIGVIRTLGATPPQVLRLFLAESGAIAALGIVAAVAIALPASLGINAAIGSRALLMPIPLVVSGGAFLGLFAGLLVVLLGVWLAVGRMLRVSVREALTYE